MPQFSRRTILAATDLIAKWSHTEINRFLLEYGLEHKIGLGSRADRANGIGRYLIENGEKRKDEDGQILINTIVGVLVNYALQRCTSVYSSPVFRFTDFCQDYPELQRGLERDGFTVEDGVLRKALPQELDLPAADDEVHMLLVRRGFAVARGHLDQGIAAHARGDWAAANAQFRAFVECLFDDIARHFGCPVGMLTSGQRRTWLAQKSPPFFIVGLNEWDFQGGGFMESFFRRLHPAGAHPGLSDEDDSTFRLHLVLLVARNLLRRIH